MRENRATVLKEKFGVSVPSLHRLFQLRFGAHLIEVACCANTAKVDQVTLDRGLECLIMPSKPGSLFSTRTLHKFLRINVGSLHLSSSLGLLWYTNHPPEGHDPCHNLRVEPSVCDPDPRQEDQQRPRVGSGSGGHCKNSVLANFRSTRPAQGGVSLKHRQILGRVAMQASFYLNYMVKTACAQVDK